MPVVNSDDLVHFKRPSLELPKIDRSFIQNMLADRQHLAIVEGVMGLSKTFHCTVVAKGVETDTQAQRLIELGCFVGQGNNVTKAMPLSELGAWMKEYTSSDRPT